MLEITGDHRDATFDDADLTGATLSKVRLNDARLRMVDLSGAVLRSVSLAGASIDGADLTGLRIDGVEVAPLVEAELDRREPARALRRAADPEQLRAAWAALEASWAATYDRVAAMPPGTVDVSVEEEWTFAETLRHLVFATDGWLGARAASRGRSIRGGVPFTDVAEFVDDLDDLGLDPTAAPTYAEVLDLRRDRVAQVRDYLATVTPEQLTSECVGPPWDSDRLPVLTCLRVILTEECDHHRYAVRDLDAIAAAAPERTTRSRRSSCGPG